MKIVYWTMSRDGSDKLQSEVGNILAARGMEITWIACRTIQAIEYAVYREDAVVLMSESCSADESCGPWDIAGLRDIRKVRVIACVDRIRYGTPYMAVLYAGGVLDALYEDDSDPHRIADLIRNGRGRSESREYYGIASMEDAVSVLQVMDRDAQERYIRYITTGIDRDEMIARYQEVTKKLSSVEKCCLASRGIPEGILLGAGESDSGKFRPPQAGKRGRFRFF